VYSSVDEYGVTRRFLARVRSEISRNTFVSWFAITYRAESRFLVLAKIAGFLLGWVGRSLITIFGPSLITLLGSERIL